MIFCTLILSSLAWAGFAAQVSGFYLSDNFTQSTLSSQARLFYSTELYYSLASQKNFFFGLDLTGLSQNDATTTATTNYSSQDYGLALLYFIDSAHRWAVAGAYNTSASGTYEATGAISKKWTGTSYWGRFGYQTDLKNGINVGLHFTYYNVDYTSQTQGSTTSSVAVNRNWVLPVLSLSYWHP